MSDDFKVRFTDTYNVHASTAKRDHVTDKAVDSTPSRDDGQRHPEFSMTPDGEREEDEAGARDEPEDAHAAPATEQSPATPVDPPADPKPGDDPGEPGGMLDLTG